MKQTGKKHTYMSGIILSRMIIPDKSTQISYQVILTDYYE